MDRFVIRNFKPAVSTEPSEAIQSSNSVKLLEKIEEGKSIGQAQQGKSFKNEHSSSSEGVSYTEQQKSLRDWIVQIPPLLLTVHFPMREVRVSQEELCFKNFRQ